MERPGISKTIPNNRHQTPVRNEANKQGFPLPRNQNVYRTPQRQTEESGSSLIHQVSSTQKQPKRKVVKQWSSKNTMLMMDVPDENKYVLPIHY